jgi:hypothetical protein
LAHPKSLADAKTLAHREKKMAPTEMLAHRKN